MLDGRDKPRIPALDYPKREQFDNQGIATPIHLSRIADLLARK